MLLGIGISVVNTRLLGSQQYGDLKFIQTIFRFVTIFVTLGLFVTGGRQIALKRNHRNNQSITGSLIFVASIVSAVLTIIIFVLSFSEPLIFKNDLGYILRRFSPFMFVFPFQLCLENLFSGSNQIYKLSMFRIMPSLIYLVAALLFNYYFSSLSLVTALLIQLISMTCVVTFFVLLVKPSIVHLRRHVSKLWIANKTHGLQSYFGSLCGVATAHLAGLALGFYANTEIVGFFSLAVSITMPLSMLPNAVGTAFYKDFANSKSIPLKVTIYTIFCSSIALLLFLLVVKKLVSVLYPAQFISIVPIAYFVACANCIHGYGDYLNRFIGAHGRGAFNRNGAIVVGVANVLGYVLLVKWYGIYGAAVTRVISAIIYLLIMYFYYLQVSRSLQQVD